MLKFPIILLFLTFLSYCNCNLEDQKSYVVNFHSDVVEQADYDIFQENFSNTRPFDLNPQNRLEIGDLTVENNPHSNRYLICRCLSDAPIIDDVIYTIVDDPSGDHITSLAVQNKNYFDFLPIGTIFLIINPWVQSDDYSTSIVVDHSRDIIILPEHHTFLKNIKWTFEIPLDHVARGDLIKSIRHLSKLIDNIPLNAELLSKRSFEYFELGYYHRALEDSEKILEILPNHENAIKMKANSLFKLEQYEKSVKYLKEIGNEKFDKILEKGEEFLRQRKEMDYDIHNYEMDYYGDGGYFEVAQYMSESIEVQDIIYKSGGKGRGVIAKKDIKAGELLVVSKVFAEYKDVERYQNLSFDFMQLKVATDLQFEPERINQFYKLSAGIELGHLPETDGKESHKIDLDRIVNVAMVNSFEMSEPNEVWTRTWTHPVSYFNHDCYDKTCEHIPIGPWMFIRAIRDIFEGQELTISYKEPSEIEDRAMGFDCKCRLCTAEKLENSNIRSNLDKYLQIAESEENWDFLENLVANRLQNLPSPVLGVQMIPWLSKLTHHNIEYGCYYEAMENLYEILNILGDKISSKSYEIIELLVELVQSRDFLLPIGEIRKFRKIYQHQAIILFGSDRHIDLNEFNPQIGKCFNNFQTLIKLI